MATQLNYTDRSSIALSPTARTQLVTDLTAKGYNPTTLNNLSNDELLELGNFEGQAEADYRKSSTDRTETMADFRSQLASLNSAKQRQAEQAGRIQEGVQRTQGLAQMMSNF